MLELTSNRFVPGPGQYNPKEVRINRSVGFGNPPDEKIKEKHKNRHYTPGPGAYRTRDDFGVGAKAVSILGRNEKEPKDKIFFSPGPGAYDSDKFNRTAGPSFSIKGAVSADPIMREKMKVPASSSYNPKDEFVRKSIPSINFGPRPPKPPKRSTKLDGPGPGSYKIPSTLDTRKGVKISENYYEKNRSLSESQEFSAGRNTVGGSSPFRKSNKRYRKKNSGPGPGAYNLTAQNFGKNCKKNIIFLSRPKEKSNKFSTPGPGAYTNNVNEIGKNSKGIIFTRKT